MKYKIIMAENPITLGSMVGDEMNRGWKPQGGLCIDTTGSGGVEVYYYQAMIYNPAPKPPGKV